MHAIEKAVYLLTFYMIKYFIFDFIKKYVYTFYSSIALKKQHHLTKSWILPGEGKDWGLGG